ncbi:MAG: hypothetical protein M3O15_01510 [Acidobacteriota bacterium]|nr:hypothetical protein [Acidobacteriota bacterium]
MKETKEAAQCSLAAPCTSRAKDELGYIRCAQLTQQERAFAEALAQEAADGKQVSVHGQLRDTALLNEVSDELALDATQRSVWQLHLWYVQDPPGSEMLQQQRQHSFAPLDPDPSLRRFFKELGNSPLVQIFNAKMVLLEPLAELPE